MRGGNFDQRIQIERLSVVVDPDYGPLPNAWLPVDVVWGEVQDVLPSKAETQAQGIRIASRPARVRIRYTEGITSDMRLVLLDRGNRVLNIVSGPAEMGRYEGLEMMAEEFTTTGDT